MSRFAQQSPERQIPWLPGERFELALDSRHGAVNTSTTGDDKLTITTHRVIRLGGSGGAKTTELVPLDRLSAVQVVDISRDSGRLVNALAVLGIGLVLAWVTWIVFDGVFLFSLVVGGVPVLISVYLLTGWLFPDEEGALLLHSAGHTVRQPLLSEQSRHDAYLVAHRVYELMARAAPQPIAQAPAPAAPAPASASPAPNAYLGSGQPAPSANNGTSPELAAVMSAPLVEDHAALVPDVAERIALALERTSAARSYATHQTLRDPNRESMAAGDYLWDMEYVAPDRYRVSQTGWSEAGTVSDRWLIVGGDFYRDAHGAWRPEDPSRFAAEQTLSKHLSPHKYLDILRQGYPSRHEVDSGGGKRFLQLAYSTLTRESLATVLANPSPPQGVAGSAKLWIDMETDLLAKAEIRISESDSDRQLLFEQAFASYNAGQQIEAPAAVS